MIENFFVICSSIEWRTKVVRMKTEIVVDNLCHLNEALKYDIDRIELCSALDLGGLTPDYHFVEYAASLHNDVHVLIRPRQGNFLYSDIEKKNIESNIDVFAKLGVKGVVFGALDKNNDIDYTFVKIMSERCKTYGLEATFNRAFDFSNDYEKSLDILEHLCFHRVLTAGCKTIFNDGVEKVKNIVDFTSNYNLGIIAAGSICVDNMQQIVNERIKVESIHFQVRKKQSDSAHFGVEYTFNDSIINEMSKLVSTIKRGPMDKV